MKKNIGTPDRIVRLVLAILFFIGIFFTSNVVGQIILGAASLFTVYEALVGWCAFYALIGKNTCPLPDIEIK